MNSCANFKAMNFGRHPFFGKKTYASLAICGLLISIVGSMTASGQSADVKFGQNRVQYKDFAFQYYESDHFITYFYPGGQDIAKYVIKTAEDQSQTISDILNYKYRRKLDIIVYNTVNELNQTNIGIYAPETNEGTTISLNTNKLFIYFNGDHANLDKQIKTGLAKAYVDRSSIGTGVGELLVNAVLFSQPDWYRKGLISYLGETWSADMEDRLRDGIMTGRYSKLNKLSPEESVFVGHSIWRYVEEVYGKAAVANLIYLSRINRSVDNGFLFATGNSVDETLQAWYKYYASRFNNEIKYTNPRENEDLIKKRNRKETSYYQPRLSPDGKHIAYASNNLGRYKIHLLDTETKKRKVIYRGGWRTKTLVTDESVPLTGWSPKGDKLAFVFDKKNIVRLCEYDLTKKKHKKEFRRIEKFQKVTSFSYADNKSLAIAAVRNGQSDIFLYTIASQTVRQITNDYFDDFTPAIVTVDSIRGVVFASNRTEDTLRTVKYDSQSFSEKQRDLYFYDLDNGENVLYRVTNTPNANESYPQPFNDTHFSYLSEKNGIRNQYLASLEVAFDHNQKTYHFYNKESKEEDSISLPENQDYREVLDTSVLDVRSATSEPVYRMQGKSVQFSNFASNIMEQNLVPDKSLAMDRVLKKGVSEFYKYQINGTVPDGKTSYIITDYMKRRSNVLLEQDSIKKEEEDRKLAAENEKMKNGGKKIYTGQDFQSEFDYGVKLFDWDSAAAANNLILTPNGAVTVGQPSTSGYIFRFSKVRPYFVRFMIEKFAAQIDNNLLIDRYQVFNPQNPNYNYQPLNALFKIGITDLFEDYKIYGGITIPVAGSGGSLDLGYFLVYENLRKRWDKKFTFFYQTLSKSTSDKVPFYNTQVPEDAGTVNYGIKTTYLEAEFKYPFDVFHSIRLTGAYRNDRYVFKTQDTFSMRIPTYVTNWVYVKGEYIFDNTINIMTNIRQGFRAKAFAEFHKEIPTKSENGIGVPGWNNTYFVELGFDARYYLKIYKQMILATRMSFATSLGNAKVVHFLGGVDNDIASLLSSSNAPKAPVNSDRQNYVYQTVASPMRGFTPNSRNGTSYALINAELRIPFFTLLMNRPSKSELIRNFMIVGFFDCGTAWEGLTPFSGNNPVFNTTFENSTSLVTLKQTKTPVIMGSGFGFRTSLLAYFIKLDIGWGLDTGVWSDKPIYNFGLGYDF